MKKQSFIKIRISLLSKFVFAFILLLLCFSPAYGEESCIIGSCDTPGEAHDVYVSGNYAYIADWGSGLQIIDVSNPRNATIIGSCDIGRAVRVYVSGNHAYIVDGRSRLQIIDISNPSNPRMIWSCNTPGYAEEAVVLGDYAYVAAGSSGLQVIDVSNPNNATIIGSCDTLGYAERVHISGNYVYVIVWGLEFQWLQIIDVSNPYSPKSISSIRSEGARDVYVSGNHAFVVGYDSDIHVFHISPTGHPTRVGRFDNHVCYSHDIYILGDIAYVADQKCLLVFNVFRPSRPTLIGSCNTPGYAQGVHVSGSYAYVADRSSGLQIVDIAHIEPFEPSAVGGYVTDASTGMPISDAWVYLDDSPYTDRTDENGYYIIGDIFLGCTCFWNPTGEGKICAEKADYEAHCENINLMEGHQISKNIRLRPSAVPEPKNVAITNIFASPDPVSPGDTVSITVDTCNDGAAGFADVGVTVWDPLGDYCNLKWQGYNFEEGESHTFTYSYTVPDDAELGSYDVGAGAWDDCTGTCEGQCCPDGLCSGPHNEGLIRNGLFEVHEQPNVAITNIFASPDPVSPGDTVTITVDTCNDGAAGFADVGVTVWDPLGDYCNLKWQGYNFDEGETPTHTYLYTVPDDAELGSYDAGARAWDGCTGTCEGQCCPDGLCLCSGPHNDGLIREGVFEVELPDLTISPESISFPFVFIDGDTIRITVMAEVRNVGMVDVKKEVVLVRFFNGDPETGNQIGDDCKIPSLPADTSADPSVDFTVGQGEGTYDIYVVVDPEDTIAECNDDVNPNTAHKETTIAIANIAGVPCYDQYNYPDPWWSCKGKDACGPVASACVLSYWDDRGYDNLVDGTDVDALVQDLKLAQLCCNGVPYHGTSFPMAVVGLLAVCNDQIYGNNHNFHAEGIQSVNWQFLKTEINGGRPLIYGVWDHPNFHYEGHYTALSGYVEIGSNKWLYACSARGDKILIDWNIGYDDSLIVLRPPPIAEANGPYTGVEGAPIAFDGTGSYDPDGNIASYAWDFGDGNTGTVVSQDHTYAQEGTYTVTLVVNDGVLDSVPDATTATVTDTEPTADFNAVPTSGPEPLTVEFTDLSSSYDGIVSWSWDFGDGETSNERNPTHTYISSGTYTVALTVTEADDDTATKEDYITVTSAGDTIPPVIESVTLDAYTTIPDATIHVTVEATDNVGVTSVTADGIALVETGSTWEGDITAPSATGDYTLTVIAEDAAGNVAEAAVDYSVVTPTGGLGVGISPRATTASAGDAVSYIIIVSSTENFDGTIHVYVSMDRLSDSYKLDMTAFDWVEQDVQIRAGEKKEIPLVVTIPAGETGRKVFRIKAESTSWASNTYDSALITIT